MSGNTKDFKVKSGIQPTVYHEAVGTVVSGSDAYSLTGASYDSVSFSVAGQETLPRSLYIKSDGLSFYITGTGSDTVYQYAMSTAWDLSTASYASKSFSVASQTTFPTGVYFKSDGTKMYVLDDISDVVFQYSLSTSWDVSTASYDSVSVSVSSHGTAPSGLTFGDNGTKMYVTANGSDTIGQYNLSTAWDLSTASYASKTLSVTLQDPSPMSIYLTEGGLSLFLVGIGNDSVYKYDLSTAWDISTAVYSNTYLYVATEDTSPYGVYLKQDGTKLYISGGSTDTIYQYSTVLTTNTLDLSTGSVFEITPTSDIQVSLSNPAASGTVSGATLLLDGAANTYDLSGASYDSKSFSVAGQETIPYSVNLNNDGTKMFVLGQTGDDVNEYNLSTPWDISTASYDSIFSVATQETQPWSFSFKSDGTAMYVVGGVNNTVYQYTLTTGFDVSTASYASKSFSVVSQTTSARSLTFRPDGTKMYVLSNSGGDIHQYTLSTAWDVSTASYDSVTFNVITQAGNPYGITFSGSGTELFVANYTDNTVYQYNLTTAYDISTASYSSTSFDLSSQTTTPTDVFFGDNGTKMYINSAGDDTIYQYTTGGGYTITYDTSLQWAGGTAPTSPALGETDVLTFNTTDGGTTYNAALAIDGAS